MFRRCMVSTQVAAWLSLACLASLAGCSGTANQPQSSTVAIIPVTDFKSVAGKWEGVGRKMPSMETDGWVIVKIEKHGTFEFVNTRFHDVLVGAGVLSLRDGMLVSESDTRFATFTLYGKDGHPVMVAEATNKKTGDRYRAELTRQK